LSVLSSMDAFFLIINAKLEVPQTILAAYPSLNQKLLLTTIPLIPKDDKLIWKVSHDGSLTFKDAYMFHAANHSQIINWAKAIWNNVIPPSKSFLVWRLLHDKLPPDDNLIKRGCQFSSMCSLCGTSQETSYHVFIDCPFAYNIWYWLGSILNLNCNSISFLDIIRISDRN